MPVDSLGHRRVAEKDTHVARAIISRDELSAHFKERMRGRLGGDCDACILSVYLLKQPDVEGCNWLPAGWFGNCHGGCVHAAGMVIRELRPMFNIR